MGGVPLAEHHNQYPDKALTKEPGICNSGFSVKEKKT